MIEQDDWVAQEMKDLTLDEKRLEKRACKIIRDMTQNPTGSIPEFSGDWAATKAAYEFFKNRTVAATQLVKAQCQATVQRIEVLHQSSQATILILQDTSSFDFTSHSATAGLGILDNKNCQGFLAHSSLAVTPDQVPLGLLAQQSWVRDGPTDEPANRQAAIEDKESYKWLQALDVFDKLKEGHISGSF
jgi:hypothetical protein